MFKAVAYDNACYGAFMMQITDIHFAYIASAVNSEFVKKNPGIGDDPIDIEDLVNIGKSSGS